MQNKIKTHIKEFFTSIQGEGRYIGYKQLFIRFCRCNLACSYCDTDFFSNLHTKKYTPEELKNAIEQKNLKNIHSISLTGGEPLLDTDFLLDFLPLLKHKIYLETNGTLYKELQKLIELIDIISMDIKLPSSTQNKDLFKEHREFLNLCLIHKKDVFTKVVFNSDITQNEIKNCIALVKDSKTELILQPMMKNNSLAITSTALEKIFYNFADKYENVRLLPQMHKFINVE